MKSLCIRRFFARLIDLAILMIPIWMLYGFAIHSFDKRFSSYWILRFSLSPSAEGYLFYHYYIVSRTIDHIVLFMIPAFMNAALMALFFARLGTTPGKAILGIRLSVCQDNLSSFSRWSVFFRREIGCWIWGLGAGGIVLASFCMVWQAIRLQKGKPAFYDRHHAVAVEVASPAIRVRKNIRFWFLLL